MSNDVMRIVFTYLEADQPAAFDQDVESGDHAGEVLPGLSVVWCVDGVS